jgi:TolB-like protein
LNLSAWVQELKRRRVFRALAGYGLAAFAVLQVVEPVMHGLGLPEWVLKIVVIGLGLGLPITILVAWAYDFNPDGIERTPSTVAGRGWRTVALVALGLLLAAPGVIYYLLYRGHDGGATAAAGSVDHSVAVLPFVNMSGDPENEYFSDGLSEEILNALAQLPGLRVPARTSAFAFKGKAQDVKKIAEALQVATVLEGSVRKAAGRVRITAQLVNAADGFHLWSRTFDRDLKDVFAVQDEISQAIAAALKLRLAPAADGPARQPDATAHPDAHEAYLLGRHALNERTRSSIEQAVGQFRRAMALDPSFALPYADAAIAEILLGRGNATYGDVPMSQAVSRARPLLERALALAPDHPQVLAAAGFVEEGAQEHERALRSYDRALALNPNAAEVHFWRRYPLEALGLYEQVPVALAAAVKADPLSRIVLANYVQQMQRYGRDREVGPALVRLRSLDEGFAEWAAGLLADDRGERAEAVRHLLPAAQRGRDKATYLLAVTLADLGLREEALRVGGSGVPSIHRALGDGSQAVELARAAAQRAPGDAEASFDLMASLYVAGHFEGAAAMAAQRYQASRGMGLDPGVLLLMADGARRTGRVAEAASYRDLAGQRIERMQRAGVAAPFLDSLRVRLAAYEGRDEEAVALLSGVEGIYPFLRAELELPVYSRLLLRPDYRAILGRIDARLARQRAQVVELLCGPNPLSPTWRPAPETCAGHQASR